MDWECMLELARTQAVVLLLRHAERPEIPEGETGHDLPLTDAGVASARQLGRLLSSRLRGLSTSPIRRCYETARALREGAGAEISILKDSDLGDPGVYVADSSLAWENWQSFGNAGVIQHLMSADFDLPGMNNAFEASRRLLCSMESRLCGDPGVDILITHDSVLTPFLGQLLGVCLPVDDWPKYLEGCFCWQSDCGTRLKFKTHLVSIETD